MKVFDYLCHACWTLHEEMVSADAKFGDAGAEACPMCGGETFAVPVAPLPQVATAMPGFDRGKSDEKPGPAAMDTRALAHRDKSPSQWRKERRAMWRDRDRAKELGHRDKKTIRR